MDIMAILNNVLASQFGWVALVIMGVVALPFVTVIVDVLTTIISLICLEIDTQVVDKIPSLLKPVKDWLQGMQVAMLEASIKKLQDTIVKIKEN